MNIKQKDKLPLISDEELKEIMLPTDKLVEIALNDFDEQLRLDEMKKWSAEEQTKYLCPNGVIKVKDITGKLEDYVTLEELMERTAYIEEGHDDEEK